MLWRRKPPPVSSANPGNGHTVTCAYSDGNRSWSEDVDLLVVLAEQLRTAGHLVIARRSWLELPNGLTLYPQFVSLNPREGGGLSVSSTIEACDRKHFPHGLFEFQHAVADRPRDAFARGFASWAALDLPVLLDASRAEPNDSLTMTAATGAPARRRRVLMGGVQHYSRGSVAPVTDIEHPFCPCCLFRESEIESAPVFAEDRTLGIRLYAARNDDGSVMADCRINGQDFPAGAEALRRYANTWPGSGFEFRKQYALVQTE